MRPYLEAVVERNEQTLQVELTDFFPQEGFYFGPLDDVALLRIECEAFNENSGKLQNIPPGLVRQWPKFLEKFGATCHVWVSVRTGQYARQNLFLFLACERGQDECLAVFSDSPIQERGRHLEICVDESQGCTFVFPTSYPYKARADECNSYSGYQWDASNIECRKGCNDNSDCEPPAAPPGSDLNIQEFPLCESVEFCGGYDVFIIGICSGYVSGKYCSQCNEATECYDECTAAEAAGLICTKGDPYCNDAGFCDQDSSCFSEKAMVEVLNKGSIPMKDLQVGDKVLTSTQTFEKVYAFAHILPTRAAAEFLSVETESIEEHSALELTRDHLVFVQGKSHPIPASLLKVGDELVRGDNHGGTTVTKIHKVKRNGLYAPLTPDGTVVVNGVVASSYVAIQDNREYAEFQGGLVSIFPQHTIIHLSLSPFRMFCMGVSSDLCDIYKENGMPAYIQNGIIWLKWADQQNIVVQVVLFSATFLVIFPLFMLVENTFGPSYAPLAMLLAAAGGGVYWYLFLKKSHPRKALK